MLHRGIWLAVASTFFVAPAQGLWRSGLPPGNTGASLLDTRAWPHTVTDAQKALEPLAPLVVRLHWRTGSFKQLADGIVMSLVLGMQILLPASDAMLDMWHLSREVDDLYKDYWCHGSNPHASSSLSLLWCKENAYSSFVFSESDVEKAFLMLQGKDPNVKILNITPEAMVDRHDLSAFQDKLLHAAVRGRGVREHNLLNIDCALLSLKVDESDAALWPFWWRVSDALDFAKPVKTLAARFIAAIEASGELARQRAKARGFPPFDRSPAHGHAFNALHLRADEAWAQSCGAWMGLDDGIHRDNCMNNTASISVVLVTEGVDPRLPLYVDTPLTTEKLVKMSNVEIKGQYGRGWLALTEAFTVITKGTILHRLRLKSDAFTSDQWAAMDLLVASAANEYVGNSVAVESAYIMMMRRHNKKRAWHYNGGCTPLQETGALKPLEPLSIPTLREPIKWVFAIHVGESDLSKSFLDMVKVAVLSARKHTSLVPVCITTADPRSTLSTWLVQHGVRVVHHTPAWAAAMRQKVKDLHNSPLSKGLKYRSHLYFDPDAMIGTFMRIDIPILGILDEFVIYTDVDVLFKSEIDWSALLGGKDLNSIRRENDFARGKWLYAKSGTQGLPLYFAASSEIEMSEDPGKLNAGIMLMNLRSLRETYDSFKDFIFNCPTLEWEEGPGDEGAIKSFYADPTGRPQSNFLPWVLNWKSYWAPNPEAKLIHFHGPKCEADIQPYIRAKVVQRESFGFLLERCTRDGDCESLCREFDAYLS